jgi:hypothetical protein
MHACLMARASCMALAFAAFHHAGAIVRTVWTVAVTMSHVFHAACCCVVPPVLTSSSSSWRSMASGCLRRLVAIIWGAEKWIPSAVASSLPSLARGGGEWLVDQQEKSGQCRNLEKKTPPLRPSLAHGVNGGVFEVPALGGFFTPAGMEKST